MTMIKDYDALPLRRSEICRYARCTEDTLPPFFEDCLRECEKAFQFRVCYDVFPCREAADGTLDLGFAAVASQDLKKNLSGCGRIVLFAATAGMGIDVLIRRYTLLSPAKAVLVQAIGSAGAEAVCDAFCADVFAEFGAQKPRYSPGYGDLPLTIQRQIFRTLEPQKHIGVMLGDNLLMAPSKSVTAIVGLYGEKK